LIRIRGVGKRYAAAETPALQGVSFDVPAGSVFGLLGPNGAGKSTLISIIVGLLRQDTGTVDTGDGGPAAPGLIGYVPQDLAFYPSLSVRENLDLFARLTPGGGAAAIGDALAAANLEPHLATRAERLSGGLKRRLNLAIGLLGSPRLLCLDEPTANVDPQSRNFLLEAIRRLRDRGVTVLYTTHHFDEIERVCDRAAILDHGRLLVEGPLAQLLDGGQRLEELFLRLTGVALRG
jgi:ABC-2 type transport system ATP-binding protein